MIRNFIEENIPAAALRGGALGTGGGESELKSISSSLISSSLDEPFFFFLVVLKGNVVCFISKKMFLK